MRALVDYRKRAEECRKLAKLAGKPEDWGHFLEMAETWEMLAKQYESDLEWEAQRIAANVAKLPELLGRKN